MAQFGGISIPEQPEPVFTAWGIPLEEGPIRAVAIVRPEASRDANELARRLELALDVFALTPSTSEDSDGQERLREMLGDKVDVILVSDTALLQLTEPTMDVLLSCLSGGAGLVLGRYGHSLHPILRDYIDALEPAETPNPVLLGIGERFTPEWTDGLDFVGMFASDTSRMVALDYGAPSPASHFLLPALRHPLQSEIQYWDTYLSLVAKAVRWAAGWTPEVMIARVETHAPPMPDESEIPPDLPEEFIRNIQDAASRQLFRPVTVHLSGPAPAPYRVVGQLRQPGRDRVETIEYENRLLDRGQETYSFDLGLGPGMYYFDVWLYDRRGRVVAWHTEPITAYGWPQIADLAFSRPVLSPHDTLDTTVTIPAPFRQETPATVYIRAYDPFDRLVAEGYEVVPEGGGSVTVRTAFVDLLAPVLRIEVYVTQSGGKKPTSWDLRSAAYTHGYLPVQRIEQNSPMYLVVKTDAPAEYNRREWLADVYLLGGTGIYTVYSNEADFFLGRSGMRPVFELTRNVPETVIDDVVRIPGLADRDHLDKTVETLEQTVRGIWSADTRLFSLGEGNAVAHDEANLCQSRESLEAYRQMLEESYGELERLNAAWGTQFSQWRDIAPAPEEAAAMFEAYAPWLSFRLFMDQQFTRFHAAGAEAVRRGRPGSSVGFVAASGASSPYRGYDWGALRDALDLLVVPPERLVVEQVGPSSRTSTAHRGLLMEGARGMPVEQKARWLPWYAAMKGFNAVWWTDRPEEGLYAETEKGEAHPVFVELSEEVERLNRTIGYALRHGDRMEADIAVYVSQASRYLAHVMGEETTFARWTALLTRLGHTYDVVSREDARSGGLQSYRAVVLPRCGALDEDEIQAIRRFAERDGVILADRLPGTHTIHGLPRSQPPLADLFNREWPEEVDNDHGESLLSRAWLLDVESDDFLRDVENRLSSAGLVSDLTIEQRGESAFQGESGVYTFGKGIIYGILLDPASERARITMGIPDADTVYDPFEGSRIRRPGRMTARMDPGAFMAVVSLPYEVRDISVTAPGEALAGRRLPVQVSLDTRGESPGLHPILIEFAPFNGTPLRHYTQYLLCEEGQGRLHIPLALNEQQGRYELRVRDGLSGVQTTVPVHVMPSSPGP